MRLLFILNKAFEQDPRAQRELKALVERGDTVDVLTFRDPGNPAPSVRGATFHVFPLRRKRSVRIRYALEYALYLLWACFESLALFIRHRYRVVQVFLLPEPLFLSCVLPRLLGVKVIVDWMDLGFELYHTKFKACRWDPFPAIVRATERCVAALSDVILVPNSTFESALRERCPQVKNCRVVMNAAVSSFFCISRKPELGAVRLIYTGTISKRNGFPVLLDAFAQAGRELPELSLTILGAAVDRNAESLLKKMDGIPGVRFVGSVKHSDVILYMSHADIGIIPSSDTPFTRINLPTRLFEYGAAALPVICSDLPGIRDYFSAAELAFCRPDDPAALAESIRSLAIDEHKRRRFAVALHARMRDLSWDKAKREYLEIVSSLVPGRCEKVASK